MKNKVEQVTPALMRQAYLLEVEASLVYTVRPCPQKKQGRQNHGLRKTFKMIRKPPVCAHTDIHTHIINQQNLPEPCSEVLAPTWLCPGLLRWPLFLNLTTEPGQGGCRWRW